MKYLLDTSVYSQPLKKRPNPWVISHWKAIGDLACCVSVFCEMEVLQGLNIAESEKLKHLYRSVLKERIPILPFALEEAAIYAQLQAELSKVGKTKPVIDLCIAATALKHNCILVTLNVKDFEDIPNLKVEDWGRKESV